MTDADSVGGAGEIPLSDSLPPIAPDAFEQDHSDQIDNIVPSRGYAMLPVVALGGSAGSIQSLKTFFESVPPATGLAYVVILHLSPEHESTLPALLQHYTEMRVCAATDGEKIAANTVYVIPPGKHLTATDGHLRLSNLQRDPGKRIAVDLFFRSLADTHGAHATAVVLSGADGDGAIGLKRIKERGGLTIAQNPTEAEHEGMPTSAIATGMVDWILPVKSMPARIIAYHATEKRLRLPPENGPQPAKPVESAPDQSEAVLREVLAFLRAQTGRDFSYYKRATIVRRISRRMQVTGTEDLIQYLSHLRTHPGEAGALLQDLLISVTNFFRDREAFGAVAAHLPELFRNKKPTGPVRVWCAACATGEEAYSMAMLLLEHARSIEGPPTLQVFGCDLDEEAIQVARAGLYPDTIVADVSEERLRRFFVKESGGYRVRRELREMVLFASHDLLRDAPFSRMDLISCRNLLIYLNRDAQMRALEIFNFALKPGMLLFLGSSESVDDGSALFTAVDKKHRLYRQRPAHRIRLPVPTGAGEGAVQRALHQHERLKLSQVGMPSRTFLASFLPQEIDGGTTLGESRPANELHYKLLARFGPPSLVVDADHEIIHLSENANRFLQFPEGEPTRNLLRLVAPILRVELRTALLRATETNQTVEILRRVIDLVGGPKAVSLRVSPAGDVAPGCLLVLFEAHDAGSQEGTDAEIHGDKWEPGPAIQQLERELNRANTSLRATVEQYEASTEELKASNEELQAMNEELRSAGEELETGREELQSVNEELTTVNSEFKSRVDELARANSDLHNLVSATQIAIVFLGRELQILRYTPSAAPLFNLIPGDIGRPIAHLKQALDYADMVGDAEQVLRTLVPIQREVRDEGHWYLARVLPYRTIDDHIAGVVLSFVDITERKHVEEELKARNAELERSNDAAAGRELQIIELAKEVNELARKAGLPPRHEIPPAV
jgi:two-component system CheB/CheR fusion protein